MLERIAAGEEVIDPETLLAYVGSQRWSGTADLSSARLSALVPMDEAAGAGVGLIETRTTAGTVDLYQVLLAERAEAGPGALARENGAEVFDALAQPACLGGLLPRLLTGGEIEAPGGTLRFAAVGGEDAVGDGVRALGLDQSNSSVVFGERILAKFYRRLWPGLNPELELLHHLLEHGFTRTPELLGWFGYRGESIDATLGIVQRFAADARDGWSIALDAARSGDIDAGFLRHSLEIGQLTGELHLALADAASDPAMRPEPAGAETMGILVATVDERITEVFQAAGEREELAPLADCVAPLRERVLGAARLSGLGSQIRCHGDLHLGQLLYSGDQWLAVDFEGEPSAPVPERRRKRSPLRDLAGILRSIDYVVAHARLHGRADPHPDWRDATRNAVLGAYLDTMAGSALLPAGASTTDELLALFELERMVYELEYELQHRPDWVDIPASGIAALLDRTGA